MTAPIIGAIIYDTKDFPNEVMDDVVARLRADNVRLGGVHQRRRPGSVSNCDVDLEELSSGAKFHIYEDRGKDARGCKLDTSIFADVASHAAQGLQSQPDLVLINKFGKEEAEGRGLLDILSGAVSDGIPLLICVPARNLDAWNDFAGDYAMKLRPDRDAILKWTRAALSMAGSRGASPPIAMG